MTSVLSHSGDEARPSGDKDIIVLSNKEGGAKNVTFKEVKKKRKHRRSKSLPSEVRNIDTPIAPPKLLHVEVKELHKKKVILDTGIPELKGWTTKKEKDKLKGAVAIVL